MTTITARDLAAELDVSTETIDTIVDQLVAIDGQTDDVVSQGDTYALSPAYADQVREQVAAAAEQCPCLLDLEASRPRIDRAVAELEDARSERDALIRAARRHGHTGAAIMGAAGVARQTVYDALS